MAIPVSNEMRKKLNKIDKVLGIRGGFLASDCGLRAIFMSAASKLMSMADGIQEVMEGDHSLNELPQLIQTMNAFNALQAVIMSLPEEDEPETESND